MATTSLWKVEGRLAKVIDYAANPEKTETMDESDRAGIGPALLYATDSDKTERQLYVTGVNCLPDTALVEMNATKKQYGKTGGTVAFHGYQSFAPGEADAQTAHEIGVALARNVWGNRFEVVVATHLDKSHIHNHFVINSVSFADGKRFHRDNACYRAMREESDCLCKERGLSVVKDGTPGKSKHYGEWKAERDGKTTWRSLVKTDVDEAMSRAVSTRQFYANLRALGYDIKLGKDISVKPSGKERFIRLARNFGNDYTYEQIERRILANAQLFSAITKPKKNAAKGNVRYPKHSIMSLYKHYLYLLKKAKAPTSSNERAHFLLREDLRDFDRIAAEMQILIDGRIETTADLAAFKEVISQKTSELTSERKDLRNAARRAKAHGRPNETGVRITEINQELKNIKKQSSALSRIEARAKELPVRIEEIENPTTEKERGGKDGRIK